jgi:defect-in-organelle-trafficking protein DotC
VSATAQDAAGVSVTPATAESIAPPSLDDILQLKNSAVDPIVDLRNKMIGANARTVGFRAGLANRGIQYKKMLDARASILDSIFSFQTLLGPGGVLPPVIEEAKDTAAYSDNEMREATVVFKVLRQERLVSIPPTWRDYLLTGLIIKATVDLPEGDARPKNNDEMKIWQQNVLVGWKQGQSGADAIFEANLNRCTRDFNGMLRYSILLHQGVIMPTAVAESGRSVTGDKFEIKLDDRTRQITKKAELQIDPRKWNINSSLRTKALNGSNVEAEKP